MEKKTRFRLARPLLLPSPTEVGSLYLSALDHELTYAGFQPNPEKKELKIALLVVNSAGKAMPLKQFEITAEGTETDIVLNAAAIQKAHVNLAMLVQKIEDGKADIAQKAEAKNALDLAAVSLEGKELDQNIAEKRDIIEAIFQAETALKNIEKSESELIVPEPIRYRAFKYEDVIEWFDREGRLLPEALDQALSIPFMGRPMRDWVEIIEA